MPKSPFFSKSNTTEKLLYQNLINEVVHIYGENILYLPRKIVNIDKLFLEDPLSTYNDSYLIEAYQENQDVGFGEDSNYFGKFGIEVNDKTTYVIPKYTFDKYVLNNSYNINTKPNEGDIIYNIMSSELFQINFVENEIPYRQLGEVFVYKLYCTSLRYSDQLIVIDSSKNIQDYNHIVLKLTNGNGSFIVNENVIIDGNVNGEVIHWNDSTLLLGITKYKGNIDLLNNKPIIGETSNVQYNIVSATNFEDSDITIQTNLELQKQANSLVQPNTSSGEIPTHDILGGF